MFQDTVVKVQHINLVSNKIWYRQERPLSEHINSRQRYHTAFINNTSTAVWWIIRSILMRKYYYIVRTNETWAKRAKAHRVNKAVLYIVRTYVVPHIQGQTQMLYDRTYSYSCVKWQQPCAGRVPSVFKRRKHPSVKEVYIVWEAPLFANCW